MIRLSCGARSGLCIWWLPVLTGLLAACSADRPAPLDSRQIPGSETSIIGGSEGSGHSGAARTHIVVPGDTLFSVAWQAGLNFVAVAAWNHIDEPYTIFPGQRLRLYPPGADESAAPRPPTSDPFHASPSSAPAKTVASSRPGPSLGASSSPKEPKAEADKAPLKPVGAVDKADSGKGGPSRSSTERAPADKTTPDKQASSRSATEKNAPDRVSQSKAPPDKAVPDKPAISADKGAQEKARQERLAQEKALHDKAAQEKAAQERAAQEKLAQEKAVQEKAAQEKAARQRAEQERAEAEKAAQERQARARDDQPAARAASASWQWPVDGKIVDRFQPGDRLHQGIEIAGALGQSVRAARAGRVVYSGTGLVGYGKLIIIKHDKSYLSAYAFNRNILASQGQDVATGEVIAEMGNRPDDATPVLHFEIRKDGSPVNPMTYLP